MVNICNYIDFGLSEYKKTWNIQEDFLLKMLEEKQEQNNQHYLLFCEHPHVFTLGKSGKENNLLINEEFLKKIKATYFKTNRGGDITYHGPGQIVGYPIFNLNKLKIGVKKYIYLLEQTIIDTLKEYSIESERLNSATGVWLDVNTPGKARKICAIGVRLSRSITMHGFALNVNTDLSYFNYINPCGFNDKGVTSMQKELKREISFEYVKDVLLKNLKQNFNLEIIKKAVK